MPLRPSDSILPDITPALQAALAHAAQLIEQADALVVAAGAGMGVDSGLPDFRGQQGFWQAYPALGREQIDFTQIASPQAFVISPERAWGFYGHRLALYRRTVPHAGFALLKQWGEAMPQGCSVFTSNVDGQFQMAGFAPQHPPPAMPARLYRCDLVRTRLSTRCGRRLLSAAQRPTHVPSLPWSGAAQHLDVWRLGLAGST